MAGSDSLLRRGWCLWELGLRAHSKNESLIIGSLGFLNDLARSTAWIRFAVEVIGYDFYGHMELYDPSDRKSIEWGLKRVFDYDVPRINKAIAFQVSKIPI